MSVRCQIKVYKTTDDVVRPGSILSGILKYDIEEETVCNKITVSFKGSGYLVAKRKKRENNLRTHRKCEQYTKINYIIYRHETGAKIPTGTYQTEFHFIVPESVPPTLKYKKKTLNHLINCNISYYISIQFERSGLKKYIKKFKRPVKVIPIAIPKSPAEPTTYSDQQILKRLLSGRTSILKITATITNSVIRPGEKIRIQYEVNNDTHVDVKSVVTQLIEVYTIKSKKGKEIRFVEDLNNAMKVAGTIKTLETKIRAIKFTVPLNLGTVKYSNLVSREYFVMMILELPPEYENMVLKIPVEIGHDVHTALVKPPSYWDVLQEDGIDDQFRDLTLSEVDESETEL